MVWIMLGVTALITSASFAVLYSTQRTRANLEQLAPACAALGAALVGLVLIGLWACYPPMPASPQPPTATYAATVDYLDSHKVAAVYVDTASFAANQTDGELAYLHLRSGRWVTGVVPGGSTDDLAAHVVTDKVHVLDIPPLPLHTAWQRYDGGPTDPRSTVGMIWALDCLFATGVLIYLVVGQLHQRQAIRAFERSLSDELNDPQDAK